MCERERERGGGEVLIGAVIAVAREAFTRYLTSLVYTFTFFFFFSQTFGFRILHEYRLILIQVR